MKCGICHVEYEANDLGKGLEWVQLDGKNELCHVECIESYAYELEMDQ